METELDSFYVVKKGGYIEAPEGLEEDLVSWGSLQIEVFPKNANNMQKMQTRIKENFGFPKVLTKYNSNGVLTNIYLHRDEKEKPVPVFNRIAGEINIELKMEIENNFLKPYIKQMMGDKVPEKRGMQTDAINIGVFLSQNPNSIAICFNSFLGGSCSMDNLTKAYSYITTLQSDGRNIKPITRFTMPIYLSEHVNLALFDGSSITHNIDPKAVMLFDASGPNIRPDIQKSLLTTTFRQISEEKRPETLCSIPIQIQQSSSCGPSTIGASHYFSNTKLEASILGFSNLFTDIQAAKPLILNIIKATKIVDEVEENYLVKRELEEPFSPIDKDSLNCIILLNERKNLIDQEDRVAEIDKIVIACISSQEEKLLKDITTRDLITQLLMKRKISTHDKVESDQSFLKKSLALVKTNLVDNTLQTASPTQLKTTKILTTNRKDV